MNRSMAFILARRSAGSRQAELQHRRRRGAQLGRNVGRLGRRASKVGRPAQFRAKPPRIDGGLVHALVLARRENPLATVSGCSGPADVKLPQQRETAGTQRGASTNLSDVSPDGRQTRQHASAAGEVNRTARPKRTHLLASVAVRTPPASRSWPTTTPGWLHPPLHSTARRHGCLPPHRPFSNQAQHNEPGRVHRRPAAPLQGAVHSRLPVQGGRTGPCVR